MRSTKVGCRSSVPNDPGKRTCSKEKIALSSVQSRHFHDRESWTHIGK